MMVGLLHPSALGMLLSAYKFALPHGRKLAPAYSLLPAAQGGHRGDFGIVPLHPRLRHPGAP